MMALLEPRREYGITILRVMLGITFLMHGYLGAFILTPAGLTAFNVSNGIPFPVMTAWFVIFGHFLGGTALLLGAYTRLGALVNILIIGGAIWFIHLKQGFFMKGITLDAAKGSAVAGGYEYALVLLVASVAVLLLGSGPLALDRGSKRVSLSP
jgi:putative oxidoreductase